MSETVAEWKLFHQKTPGCCGMEFHHFYPESTIEHGSVVKKDNPFSYEWFLKHVKLPEKQAKQHNTPYMLKSLVLFSASENQKKQPYSSYALVQWLKGIGEQITESPWINNYSSSYKIQCYIWNPSEDFRKKLHAAYEAKYGKTAVPQMITQAVCNHDWMV